MRNHSHFIQVIVLAALAVGAPSVSALPPGEALNYPARDFGDERERDAVADAAATAVANRNIPVGQRPLHRSGEADAMKTREQVNAEARAAVELGALPHGQFAPVITPDERREIRMAGLEMRMEAQ